MMFKRLYTFLCKHYALNSRQYGFRQNHSTVIALLEVVDSIYDSIDSGNIIVGIYMDLQKALDTAVHEILLHKLYCYGVRGTTHE